MLTKEEFEKREKELNRLAEEEIKRQYGKPGLRHIMEYIKPEKWKRED